MRVHRTAAPPTAPSRLRAMIGASAWTRKRALRTAAIALTTALLVAEAIPTAQHADAADANPWADVTIRRLRDGTGHLGLGSDGLPLKSASHTFINSANGFFPADDTPDDGVVASGDTVTYEVNLQFKASTARKVTVLVEPPPLLKWRTSGDVFCKNGHFIRATRNSETMCTFDVPAGAVEQVRVPIVFDALDSKGLAVAGQVVSVSVGLAGAKYATSAAEPVTVVSAPAVDVVVTANRTLAQQDQLGLLSKDWTQAANTRGTFYATPEILAYDGWAKKGAIASLPWWGWFEVTSFTVPPADWPGAAPQCEEPAEWPVEFGPWVAPDLCATWPPSWPLSAATWTFTYRNAAGANVSAAAVTPVQRPELPDRWFLPIPPTIGQLQVDYTLPHGWPHQDLGTTVDYPVRVVVDPSSFAADRGGANEPLLNNGTGFQPGDNQPKEYSTFAPGIGSRAGKPWPNNDFASPRVLRPQIPEGQIFNKRIEAPTDATRTVWEARNLLEGSGAPLANRTCPDARCVGAAPRTETTSVLTIRASAITPPPAGIDPDAQVIVGDSWNLAEQWHDAARPITVVAGGQHLDPALYRIQWDTQKRPTVEVISRTSTGWRDDAPDHTAQAIRVVFEPGAFPVGIGAADVVVRLPLTLEWAEFDPDLGRHVGPLAAYDGKFVNNTLSGWVYSDHFTTFGQSSMTVGIVVRLPRTPKAQINHLVAPTGGVAIGERATFTIANVTNSANPPGMVAPFFGVVNLPDTTRSHLPGYVQITLDRCLTAPVNTATRDWRMEVVSDPVPDAQGRVCNGNTNPGTDPSNPLPVARGAVVRFHPTAPSGIPLTWVDRSAGNAALPALTYTAQVVMSAVEHVELTSGAQLFLGAYHGEGPEQVWIREVPNEPSWPAKTSAIAWEHNAALLREDFTRVEVAEPLAWTWELFSNSPVLGAEQNASVLLLPFNGDGVLFSNTAYDGENYRGVTTGSGARASRFAGSYTLTDLRFSVEDTNTTATLWYTTDGKGATDPSGRLTVLSPAVTQNWHRVDQAAANCASNSANCLARTTGVKVTIDPHAGQTVARVHLTLQPVGNNRGDQYVMWPSQTDLTKDFDLPRPTKLVGGNGHSLAVDSLGNTWGWGYSGSGQVGDAGYTFRPSPTKLLVGAQPGRAVTHVEAGLAFSAALDTSGAVWAWGNNANGQIGIGSFGSTRGAPTAVRVSGSAGTQFTARAIAAGYSHVVAVDLVGTDGAGGIWSWGSGGGGQLGNGTTVDRFNPGRVLLDGADQATGTQLRGRQVAAGQSHSVAIDQNGYVWTWGSNSHRQLGIGLTETAAPSAANPQKVLTSGSNQATGTQFRGSAIAAGNHHTMAIDADGYLWTWGSNQFGQLGTGAGLTSYAANPVRVRIPGTTTNMRAQAIYAGETFSMAIDHSGYLWTWGRNDRGQLGDGTTENRTTPVKVLLPGTESQFLATAIAGGNAHSLAVDRSGNLWSWGGNGSGQLGDGSTSDRLTPAKATPAWTFPFLDTARTVPAPMPASIDVVSSKITGTVWWDVNGDSHLSPDPVAEPRIGGVKVTLHRVDAHGTRIDPPLAETTTNPQGFYQFDELHSGAYQTVVHRSTAAACNTLTNAAVPSTACPLPAQVRTGNGQTLPVLATYSYQDQRLDAAIAAAGASSVINLGVGTTQPDVDFGFHKPSAQISGTVWWDGNENGLIDTTEARIPGVLVELYRAGDQIGVSTPVAAQLTNESGNYTFTELAQGDYVVAVRRAGGATVIPNQVTSYYHQPLTITNTFTWRGRLGTQATDQSSVITLGHQGHQPNVNFGYFQPAPGIALDKSEATVACASGVCSVTWDVTVTNTGNLPITDAQIFDRLPQDAFDVEVMGMLDGIPATIVDFYGGNQYQYAVTEGGELYGWGRNWSQNGPLGDGPAQGAAMAPVRIGTFGDSLGSRVRTVHNGEEQRYVVTEDGRLFGWGITQTTSQSPTYYFGSIGTGGASNIPVRIGTFGNQPDSRVAQFSSSAAHRYVITESGELWGWGHYEVQGYTIKVSVGNGTRNNVTTPVRISPFGETEGLKAVQVLQSGAHRYVITADGRLFGWGREPTQTTLGYRFGALGDGELVERLTPVQIGDFGPESGLLAKQIYTDGIKHYVVTTEGMVFGWGPYTISNANYSPVGDGSTDIVTVPRRVGTFGDTPDSAVRELRPGANVWYALTADGRLYGWGRAASGFLGDGSATGTVRAIPVRIGTFGNTAGSRVTQLALNNTPGGLVLTEDGSLWGWGTTIGDGTTSARNSPVELTHFKTIGEQVRQITAIVNNYYAVTDSGGFYGWGPYVDESSGSPLGTGRAVTAGTHTLRPERIGGFGAPGNAQIARMLPPVGYYLRYIQTTEGQVFGWGRGIYWYVGDGTDTARHTPVEVSGFGTYSRPGSRLSPVTTSTVAGLTTRSYTVGPLEGNPEAIGGETAPVAFEKITAGGAHTVAMAAQSGALWTWGANDAGQLGDGTTEDRSSPVRVGKLRNHTMVQVAAGETHTLARGVDGAIWAWGSDDRGQLGLGSGVAVSEPERVPLPGARRARWVAAGAQSSYAVATDGTAWAWGRGTEGQLGTGLHVDSSTPIQVRLPDGITLTQVAAGAAHAAGLDATGRVWSWGDNSYRQLGDGSTTTASLPISATAVHSALPTDVTIVQLAAGAHHMVARASDNRVWAWGRNDVGQVGPPVGSSGAPQKLQGVFAPATVPADLLALEVAASGNYSMALRTPLRTVFTWGDNGTTINSAGPVQVLFPATVPSTTMSTIAAGTRHALSVRSDGTLAAWGANGRGQLGDGTEVSRPSPVNLNPPLEAAPMSMDGSQRVFRVTAHFLQPTSPDGLSRAPDRVVVNQAWVDSAKTPIAGLLPATQSIPDPPRNIELGEYNRLGVAGNPTCNTDATTQTPEDSCDQVPAILPGTQLQPGSLTGIAWVDQDPRDGVRQDNERRLPGVGVTLFNAAGVLIGETVTGADGGYRFDDLPPGHYFVQFALTHLDPRDLDPEQPSTRPRATWITTEQYVGDDRATDSDADKTGRTGLVAVVGGATTSGLDVGVYEVTAGIQVVKDADGASEVRLRATQPALSEPQLLTATITNVGAEALRNIEWLDRDFEITNDADSAPERRYQEASVTDWLCQDEQGAQIASHFDGQMHRLDSEYLLAPIALNPEARIVCVGTLRGLPVGAEHRNEFSVAGTGVESSRNVSDAHDFRALVLGEAYLAKIDSAGEPLGGAEFRVFASLTGVDSAGSEAGSEAAVAETPGAELPNALIPIFDYHDDGEATTWLIDLEPGTYWLREIEPPPGRQPLARDVALTIAGDGTVSLRADDLGETVTCDGRTIRVVNYLMPALPNAGGIGGGLALVLLALAASIAARRTLKHKGGSKRVATGSHHAASDSHHAASGDQMEGVAR